MSRRERWNKSENSEEYVSDLGLVRKEFNENKTWASFVKDGFGYRPCGKGFVKARDAMTAVEEAAESIRRKGSPLPPIRFPAHIFS